MTKAHYDLEALFSDNPQPLKEIHEAGMLLWRPRLEFGSYLRKCREDVPLSLRQAAGELGISFTRLQKMEAGGRHRAPDLTLLSRLAALYDVPTVDLLREAGFELMPSQTVQQELDYELEFDALAFDPALNPHGMDREWRDAYAPRVKRQWVDFAYRLEALYQREPGCLDRVLETQNEFSSPPPDSNPEAFRLWAMERMLRSGALFVTGERPEFGSYLRRLRKEKGETIQTAAREMGMSYGTLHRIETGERVVDSIEILRPIVAYYKLELEDTLRQLGVDEQAMRVLFKLETTNLDFVVLMEDKDLRPVGMTPQWMEKISAAQKRHWVEFAHRLVAYLEEGRPGLKQLVASYRKLQEMGEKADQTGSVVGGSP